MNQDTIDYLKSIGLAEPLLQHTIGMVENIEWLYGLSEYDLFVSEFIDNEGNKQYAGLWLFTHEVAVEAKNFTVEFDIDIAAYAQSIGYMRITSKSFNIKEHDGESRMQVEVSASGVSFDLRASQRNCSTLTNLIKKHLRPNITETIKARINSRGITLRS